MIYEKLYNQTKGITAYHVKTPEGDTARVIFTGIHKPTLYCYVHIIGRPMQMASVRGHGYDRITEVFSKMDNPISKLCLDYAPTSWEVTLREKGYTVEQVL